MTYAPMLGWLLFGGVAAIPLWKLLSGLIEWEGPGGRLTIGGTTAVTILTFGALAYGIGAGAGGLAGIGKAAGILTSPEIGTPNAPSITATVYRDQGDSLWVDGGAFSGSGGDTHDSTYIKIDSTGGGKAYHLDTLGAIERDSVGGNVAALDSGAVVDVIMQYKGASGGWSAPDTSVGVVMATTVPTDTIYYHNFSDSTFGGATHPWAGSKEIVFVDGPAGAGFSGKTARIEYLVRGASDDNGFDYNASTAADSTTYNDTVWVSGEFYIVPDTGLTADNRKLLDAFDITGGGVRITLNRTGASGQLRYSVVDCRSGSETEQAAADLTGITIADSVRTQIRYRAIMNSADGVVDGDLLVIADDGTSVDSATVNNVGSWIHASNCGGTNINKWRWGSQLSSSTNYNEYRYVDNPGIYGQDPGRMN